MGRVSLLFVEIREQLRGPSFRGNCLLRLCPDFVGDPFPFFFSPVNKSQEAPQAPNVQCLERLQRQQVVGSLAPG